jgi:hypothetical protein
VTVPGASNQGMGITLIEERDHTKACTHKGRHDYGPLALHTRKWSNWFEPRPDPEESMALPWARITSPRRCPLSFSFVQARVLSNQTLVFAFPLEQHTMNVPRNPPRTGTGREHLPRIDLIYTLRCFGHQTFVAVGVTWTSHGTNRAVTGLRSPELDEGVSSPQLALAKSRDRSSSGGLSDVAGSLAQPSGIC